MILFGFLGSWKWWWRRKGKKVWRVKRRRVVGAAAAVVALEVRHHLLLLLHQVVGTISFYMIVGIFVLSCVVCCLFSIDLTRCCRFRIREVFS